MSVACMPVRWSRTKQIYDAYLLAALHAKSVVDWYFAFAPVSRIETLFTLNTSFGQIIGFPFGLFGLFCPCRAGGDGGDPSRLLAVFSDATVLKGDAYAGLCRLCVGLLHVALGSRVGSGNPVTLMVLATSMTALISLHLIAGFRGVSRDRALDDNLVAGGWVAFGDLAHFHRRPRLEGGRGGGQGLPCSS